MRPFAGEVTPALEAQVAEAWMSVLGQADAVADDICLSLLEKDAEFYERTGPEFQVDVRASTREHIRRGIEAMAGVANATHLTAELWRETGRRRARQGIPMELVLNAYTLGTRVLWEALLAQGARDNVEEQVLLVAGQQVWSALDVQNAVFIEAYRRESVRLHRRDLHRQQSTLDALAEGRGANPDFATEAREVLGIGSEMAVACVVAPYDGSLDEPLIAPTDRLERHGLISHWHVRGGLYFGLLAGDHLPRDADLVALLAPFATGRAAVASSPDGVAGFATAFQLAARATDTLPIGSPAVAAVSQRLPEVLLAGHPEVAALLVRETVAPILAQPAHVADTLRQTLAALLEHDGSAKHAAEALYCHRNTVIYRAKQIEELTGRSLSDPRDKLLLSLGLLAAPG
ncbi:helix-turn-helix domain-containing protein [Nocardioides sp. YIM 152315]|uniref:PucR family transcriptional regulator n=1 Tax=Nocardioides sp. YIM 152315 TaxID=3031760 RepID=UPI0023DB5065|nr:helix-turn-helix domain-containing protein [Nocardioides sp. YIM 152315]MDF1604746.1 helix-turn-helix domain-containing protein [Nocardioides sp. YIM 152315]